MDHSRINFKRFNKFFKILCKKTIGMFFIWKELLIWAYLKVEKPPIVPLKSGEVSTFLIKYSERIFHCSIILRRTFCKLSHWVSTSFSTIFAVTPVISWQAVCCSLCAAYYLTKWKSIAIPFKLTTLSLSDLTTFPNALLTTCSGHIPIYLIENSSRSLFRNSKSSLWPSI